MIYVIISVSVILLILIIISLYIFNTTCNKKSKSYMGIFKKMGMNLSDRVNKEAVAWFKSQEVEDITIESFDGLKLHGVVLKAPKAVRTIICVHGYRGKGMYDFSNIYQYLNDNKSNLVMIDQRACGKSEGKYLTFGANEKKDLAKWIDYVTKEVDTKNPIYLYGISMGATTCLLSLEYEEAKKITGVIADCGFTSFKDELNHIFNKIYHMPACLFMIFVSMFCKIIGGFSMNEADTKKSLINNNVPVLIIHGDKDTFVPGSNSEVNYSLLKSKKQLVWIKGANHGSSMADDPDNYRDAINIFFNKYK